MNLGDGGMVEDEEVIKTLEELIIMLAMAVFLQSTKEIVYYCILIE